MAALVSAWVHRSARLSVARVRCDGHDAERVPDEHCEADGLWLVTSGTFGVRTSRGVERVDPMVAIRWREGMHYQVRHDRGGDVCLSMKGTLASLLVEDGTGLLPIGDEHVVVLRRALDSASSADAGGALALECALASAARPGPPPPVSMRSRALADELADTLRRRFDETVSLTELAEAHGISPFHACEVFRAVTGTSLHQYHLELRLRHALGLVLDTARPLAQVALDVGFASQAHLTTRFGRRFGVTPARCRRVGLPARR